MDSWPACIAATAIVRHHAVAVAPCYCRRWAWRESRSAMHVRPKKCPKELNMRPDGRNVQASGCELHSEVFPNRCGAEWRTLNPFPSGVSSIGTGSTALKEFSHIYIGSVPVYISQTLENFYMASGLTKRCSLRLLLRKNGQLGWQLKQRDTKFHLNCETCLSSWSFCHIHISEEFS